MIDMTLEYIGSYDFDGEPILTNEEIVRCRDCKFCMAYMAGTYCDYMAHAIEPDGFCAWGKRKEGGDA